MASLPSPQPRRSKRLQSPVGAKMGPPSPGSRRSTELRGLERLVRRHRQQPAVALRESILRPAEKDAFAAEERAAVVELERDDRAGPSFAHPRDSPTRAGARGLARTEEEAIERGAPR